MYIPRSGEMTSLIEFLYAKYLVNNFGTLSLYTHFYDFFNFKKMCK